MGTAEVASVADSVKSVALTLQGFEDATGNTGETFISSKVLAMTPTIAFETINDVTGATTVTINGTSTRFEEGEVIEIRAVDADDKPTTGNASVLSDGTWTVDLDLSSLKQGTITVYANGTNSLSASATEVNTTFNYSSSVVKVLIVPDYLYRDKEDIALKKVA